MIDTTRHAFGVQVASLIIASFGQTAIHAGVLELKVVDEQRQAIPCRILVRPQAGQCVVPDQARVLQIGPDRWFMSTGHCKVEVPDSKDNSQTPIEIRIERGLEFQRIKQLVKVSGQRTKKSFTLKRWVNMRSRGYLCGENHLHVDSVSLAPMLVAEGLDFGTSLTWWNGPDKRRPVPIGRGRVRTLSFAGRKVPTSIYDAELEYAWGAAYIQNLPNALPIKSDRGRPNLDYVKHAVEAGGIVHYQGGWSREVALDALLGYVHTVNVCNNNFHLHRFQPRSRYSNLLGVQGFPVYKNTDLEMMKMNTDTYYRLLNWGLDLAAGAGSATGVKQVPVGYNRAYVRASPRATLDEFNKAWAAGKNFVTNGPMLFLQTDQGHRPGDHIALTAGGGPIRLKLSAMTEPTTQQLTSIDILVNGKVLRHFQIDEVHEFSTETDLHIKRGSWIAARCMAKDTLLSDAELSAYKNADRQHPSRLRFAHTSPIYVAVGGKRAAVRESIEEGVRMLERFDAFAVETAGRKHLPSIRKAVQKARTVLESRLNDADVN